MTMRDIVVTAPLARLSLFDMPYSLA